MPDKQAQVDIMTAIAMIGCGFVADLYMRSMIASALPKPVLVFDRDPDRLRVFCKYWDLEPAASEAAFFASLETGSLVLNLTNPSSHFDVSKTALREGHHVYSEKPVTLAFEQAAVLVALASAKGLQFASAPCSVLGQAAQTLIKAVREERCGAPRLVYAELDDGFIPGAPYQSWKSESGAPWPYADEFHVGATLEHAGYYLSWLIACFGSVKSVQASTSHAARLPEGAARDFSVAVLGFENGVTARLTCSIVASHDHAIRVFGDEGVLQVAEAWDNSAPVTLKTRKRIRRRLVEGPLATRLKLKQPTHPKVKRTGAAAMNFALGVMEMTEAIAAGRSSRLSGDYALHLAEVTLAILTSGETGQRLEMTTKTPPMEMMPWAK